MHLIGFIMRICDVTLYDNWCRQTSQCVLQICLSERQFAAMGRIFEIYSDICSNLSSGSEHTIDENPRKSQERLHVI